LRRPGDDHDIPTRSTTWPSHRPPCGSAARSPSCSPSSPTPPAVVDYAIHHTGARGTPAEAVQSDHRHPPIPAERGPPAAGTRCGRSPSARLPGPCRVDTQVNGHILASTQVTLTEPGE